MLKPICKRSPLLLVTLLSNKLLLSYVFMKASRGFPHSSVGKESACNAGDPGLIPGLGRPPGEGNGYPPQYSGLENSMDCIVHGITKSQTRLSDLHFTMFLYYYGAILSKFFSLYPYPLSLRIRLNSFFRDLKFSQS